MGRTRIVFPAAVVRLIGGFEVVGFGSGCGLLTAGVLTVGAGVLLSGGSGGVL